MRQSAPMRQRRTIRIILYYKYRIIIMRKNQQLKNGAKKWFKEAENAESPIEAQIIMLDAEYDERVREAIELAEEQGWSYVYEVKGEYYAKRRVLMNELELEAMCNVQKGKMRVSVAMLMHVLTEFRMIDRNKVTNRKIARFLAFVTGFSFNSVKNYLSEYIRIDNEEDLAEANDILKGLNIKEIER